MQVFQGPCLEHSPKIGVLAELRVPVEVSTVPIQPLSAPKSQWRSVPPVPARPVVLRLETSKTPQNSSVP